MKIAISGKGGVGKTTLSALLINSLARNGRKVFAIDADPDANLAAALGFAQDTPITPLVEMRDLIKERVGATSDAPAAFFAMNPRVDDIPDRFSVSRGNIRLMAMGTIRGGGKGCACPENAFVRQLVGHLLLQRDEAVVMDMEAGIEHLGRGTARFVDCLIAVVERTALSMQTYGRIARLSSDLGIPRLDVVANRVRGPDDVAAVEKEIGRPVLGAVPFDEALRDYAGGPVSPPVAAAVESLRTLLEKELLHE